MLFPHPTSARKIYRHSMAKNLADISHLYGRIVGHVEEEVEALDSGEPVDEDIKSRQGRYRTQFLKIMVGLGVSR